MMWQSMLLISKVTFLSFLIAYVPSWEFIYYIPTTLGLQVLLWLFLPMERT